MQPLSLSLPSVDDSSSRGGSDGPLLLDHMRPLPLFSDPSLSLVLQDGMDVDSDVLSSGADNDSVAASDEEEEEDEEEDDFFARDDLYASFISSVFAAEGAETEQDGHSLCSGTDEDDEEYRPQSARGSVGDPEQDDDEDDVDIKTITNRELKQLVDYSWRMVTSTGDGEAAEEGSGGAGAATAGPGAGSAGGPLLPEEPRGPREKNLMTALLEKLLAGEEASGICVDGIQVDSLRRLVARQMSMVLQALVQMLLLCENRSGCDHECFKYLMELGNHREASVRKATLMRLQTKNVHKYTRRCAEEGQGGRSGAGGPGPGVSSDSDDDAVGYHLTRSQVAAAAAGRPGGAHGHAPCSSVFDIAAFADINALLVAIDRGRRTAVAEDLSPSAEPVAMQPPLTPQQQWARALAGLPQRVQNVLSQFRSRVWQCLVPRHDYPCRDAAWGVGSDPSSLLSRSVFTPAEDDLLLRGLLFVGQIPGPMSASENLWDTIRERFLPSKDKQLLEFRYTQLINSDSSEGDRFKSYLKLMKDRGRNQRKWSLEEDVDLLKGYQVYGDKWAMINLYFLPHRPRRELKARWVALLKESGRALADSAGTVRQDGTVTTGVAGFLSELRTRGAQAEEGVSLKGARGAVGQGIDTSIIASLREADDDVLADSDSEGSGDDVDSSVPPLPPIPPLGRSGAIPSGTLLPPMPRPVPMNGLDLMSSSAFPHSMPRAPLHPADWATHDTSSYGKLPSFQGSGFTIPSVSQLDFSMAGSLFNYQESNAHVPVPPPRSPDVSRRPPVEPPGMPSPPRLVETSLGAFSFSVPYMHTMDGQAGGDESMTHKRSASEMLGVGNNGSTGLAFNVFSPQKKTTANRSADMKGESLFEQVTR